MKNIYYIFIVFNMLIYNICNNVYAIDPQEIIKQANRAAYYQGTNGTAKITMKIIDQQQRTRTRNFIIIRKNMENNHKIDQKFYVYFKTPADLHKTAFLVWKNQNTEDDRWLYLPGLDLVKRIATSDARTSFIGSHFYYEDISGRKTTKDIHQLLEENNNYYTIKSVPKNIAYAEFAFYKTWIHKDSFIPIKTQYFDQNNKNYRTYEAIKVQNIGGFPTVVQSKMFDQNMGGFTEITYSEVKYNFELTEDIFQERYLRAPPQKYLK